MVLRGRAQRGARREAGGTGASVCGDWCWWGVGSSLACRQRGWGKEVEHPITLVVRVLTHKS